MNSLNPNVLNMLKNITGFNTVQIKQAFEHMKAIEHLSAKKFVLTDEKFLLFVTRCKDKRWDCADVGSKLAVRTAAIYGAKPGSYAGDDGIKFEFDFTNFDFTNFKW